MPTFKLYAECISSFTCVIDAPSLRVALSKADGAPWAREEPGELGPIFAASDLDHGTSYNHAEVLLALGEFSRGSDAATPSEHATITLAAVQELLRSSHKQPPAAQLRALYQALTRYMRRDDLAAEPVKKPRRRRKPAEQPDA